MVGRRSELGIDPRRQVVGIGVVDPGPRAVGRRRDVVGERAVALLERLDRLDLDRRPGQPPEVPWRDGHRPVDVLGGAGDELVGRSRDVLGIGREGRPVGGRVVTEALGPSDRPALDVDRLELLEPDPVDLLGFDVEGRPGQDLGPVQRLAVGRRPEAGLLPAGGQVAVLDRLEEGSIGRQDDVADEPLDPGPIGLGGDPRPGRHDRLVGRNLEQPLELGDGPLGDDPRGRQAAGQALEEQLAVGRHEALIGPQPGLEAVEPLGGVGGLEQDRLGQQGLRPGHLVDDLQEIRPLVVLDDRQLAHHPDHVQSDPVLERLPGGIDRRCLGQGGLHQPAAAGSTLRAGVLEAVVVAVVAVHRGRRGLLGQDRLPEPIGEDIDRGTGVKLGHRGASWWTDTLGRKRSDGRPPTAYTGRVQPPKSGICSLLRCSMAGSSPTYGSRSARVSGSRAAKACRWFDLRMCQLPSSIAVRRRGERSSL